MVATPDSSTAVTAAGSPDHVTDGVELGHEQLRRREDDGQGTRVWVSTAQFGGTGRCRCSRNGSNSFRLAHLAPPRSSRRK